MWDERAVNVGFYDQRKMTEIKIEGKAIKRFPKNRLDDKI